MAHGYVDHVCVVDAVVCAYQAVTVLGVFVSVVNAVALLRLQGTQTANLQSHRV
jgi:hypothetical protein